MAVMHFNKTPYQRDLFGISTDEVRGKFDGWQARARYTVRITVIVQIDTTNVSSGEYAVAPNITFISVNQAIINIFKVWSFTGSFSEFNNWYAKQEASLQHYIEELVANLNQARSKANRFGQWYINYALNERYIDVTETGD